MEKIKALVKQNAETNWIIQKAGLEFEYIWQLLQVDEIRLLKSLLNDDDRTAAFIGKQMCALVRAYIAGGKNNENK